jgi:hypothetical protein
MKSAPIRPSAVITDFLNHALAAGASAVGELEAEARAMGLLGERQQIQHAKAFKNSKKALGIRSIRNGFGSGGKWAWLMPLQAAKTEIASMANSHLEANEPQSIGELADAPPALSESCGIVQQWIEGVQRLDYVRCLVPSRICAGSYFWEIATAS